MVSWFNLSHGWNYLWSLDLIPTFFYYFKKNYHTNNGDRMKILITGAGSNIGFETGIKLAKLNHLVYLTVHHDYEVDTVLEKVKELKLDNNIECFKLDITNESDCKKIRKLDIDCLINNAAIGIGGSMLEIPIDLMKENFEVNVFSTLRLTQIYLGHLFANNKKGKVIFTSSIAGIIPISFLGSYCATKASLITIATVLKREIKLLTNNIQVKLIEPGIYNTGFNDIMIENKLERKSSYFDDLESISLKQKKLFELMGHDDLDSITKKVAEAVLDNSDKFLYRAPLLQVIMTKLYMLLFK